MIYRTRDGDTVDEIAWRYYGVQSPDVLRQVFDANPGLADHGVALPFGLMVELPDIARPAGLKTGVSLWM